MDKPTQPRYPGAYVQEVGAAAAVAGAPTSVVAFVGLTESGPLMAPTLVTSWSNYQQQFGSLAWMAMVPWSVQAFCAEGGAICYVVRAADTAHARAAMAGGDLALRAATAGTWGNALRYVVVNDGTAAGPDGTTDVFDLRILVESALVDGANPAAAASQVLLCDFVRQNRLARHTLDGTDYFVLEQFVGLTAANMATRVNSRSLFVRLAPAVGTDTPKRPANCGPLPLQGGTVVQPDFGAATRRLTELQGVALLSVPDIATSTDGAGNRSLTEQGTKVNAGLQQCEALGSLFYVVDAAPGLGVDDILAFKTGLGTATAGNTEALTSEYGAIYYPWVYVFNAAAGVNVPIAPSGPVLGRYAFTDTSTGVFKAPAGVDDGALTTVAALAQQVTQREQDSLNPAGINALRQFPNYGLVIWGARTLSTDPQWTYVSVRRLCIYVEQSLKNGLQGTTFEPGGPALWSSVTREASAFMSGLWQQGALFGSSATQAYFVTCDASNNPPQVQEQGLLNLDIGLAPTFPGEFVLLRVELSIAV